MPFSREKGEVRFGLQSCLRLGSRVRNQSCLRGSRRPDAWMWPHDLGFKKMLTRRAARAQGSVHSEGGKDPLFCSESQTFSAMFLWFPFIYCWMGTAHTSSANTVPDVTLEQLSRLPSGVMGQATEGTQTVGWPPHLLSSFHLLRVRSQGYTAFRFKADKDLPPLSTLCSGRDRW